MTVPDQGLMSHSETAIHEDVLAVLGTMLGEKTHREWTWPSSAVQ